MKDFIITALIILVIIFLIVFGCNWAVYGYHTPFKRSCYIEQDVHIPSYIDCEYSVITYLRITDSMGLNPKTEKTIYDFRIKKENVCKIKELQYEKMYPEYLKVIAFLESGVEPCK